MKQMPLPELPGTKVEVEKVNEQLFQQDGRQNSWFQQDATEDRIKQISGPAVLHIATHGFFLKTLTWVQERRCLVLNLLRQLRIHCYGRV